MAKTAAATLIADLAKRLDLDSTDSSVRADMLRQLNISQQAVLQDHSLRFMTTSDTLSLATANSSAAVPTTLDDGKTMTLGRAGGDGALTYVPPDEWFTTRIDTYREPTSQASIPSCYTIAQVAGVRTFLFKPGNTSGGTLSIPYLAQLIPVVMTDASNSYSMLPEGWEDTLLLDHAEVELRRFNGEAVPAHLLARAQDKQERLYASFRTSKEQPMTDREQSERKVAREELAPER